MVKVKFYSLEFTKGVFTLAAWSKSGNDLPETLPFWEKCINFTVANIHLPVWDHFYSTGIWSLCQPRYIHKIYPVSYYNICPNEIRRGHIRPDVAHINQQNFRISWRYLLIIFLDSWPFCTAKVSQIMASTATSKLRLNCMSFSTLPNRSPIWNMWFTICIIKGVRTCNQHVDLTLELMNKYKSRQ